MLEFLQQQCLVKKNAAKIDNYAKDVDIRRACNRGKKRENPKENLAEIFCSDPFYCVTVS